MKIFVDSDVVISSLLSNSGAAYLLLHNIRIIPMISTISQNEILKVMIKLAIKKSFFEKLQNNHLQIVPLLIPETKIKKQFSASVFDEDDAHIVAGAKSASVRFLITYNLKDYNIEKVKRALHIIILTPGQFLQYLRSQE